MTRRVAAALGVAAAGCAAGLAAFPRHTVAAILVATAIAAAISRRAALVALTTLLITGAFGLRADSFRHNHAPPTHHHERHH